MSTVYICVSVSVNEYTNLILIYMLSVSSCDSTAEPQKCFIFQAILLQSAGHHNKQLGRIEHPMFTFSFTYAGMHISI